LEIFYDKHIAIDVASQRSSVAMSTASSAKAGDEPSESQLSAVFVTFNDKASRDRCYAMLMDQRASMTSLMRDERANVTLRWQVCDVHVVCTLTVCVCVCVCA
jgi:hypothetical protein